MKLLFKSWLSQARGCRAAAVIGMMLALFASQHGIAQGWVAEVFIQIDHERYANERIDFFRLTYSGVTVTGQSETGGLKVMVPGNTPLSGEIRLSVNGLAWMPYHRVNPPTEVIQITLRENHEAPCTSGIFESSDEASNIHLYFRILVHPRMEVSEFRQQCDQLTLTSNTCSLSHTWEVSESISGGFKTLTGKTGRSIVITHEDLAAMGFSSPYGRKYFRVTGVQNTTSQLQAIDLYYPGPSASLESTPPKCRGSSDGTVVIGLASASPVINDFVVTLLNQTGDPLAQHYVMDANRIVLNDLRAGSYRARIENNTQIGTYGNCWTETTFELTDPPPVIISSADIADYNGFQVSCSGSADGIVSVTPAGGTGAYTAYEWFPDVSTTQVASGLSEGTYQVRVRDSNECWSSRYAYDLTEPDELTMQLLSTGGMNGFDVSCHDNADGKIQADVSGGVYPYSYAWSDGGTGALRDNLTPGLYAVTVSDRNGCVSHDGITLISPDPIDLAIQETQEITCPGGQSGALEIQSVNNAIGAITATWSSGESGFQINDKPAGVYTATVTDAQGCSATKGYELKEPPAYSAELQVTSDYNGGGISCHGFEDGELTAVLRDNEGKPTVGDDYVWYRNGVELQALAGQVSARGLKAGFYKVEVVYRASCQAQHTRLLTEPEAITASIAIASDYNGMPISCAGREDGHLRAFASGGTGVAYQFTWHTGATGPELKDIGAGTFHVTATDINGCAASAEKTITSPDSLTTRLSVLSNYNGQAISCPGSSDASLRATPRGGTPPYRFAWDAGQTDPLLIDVPAGRYAVTTLDANGCSHVADTTLVDPSPVKAMIGGASDYHGFGVSCYEASDGHLLAVGSGGTGNYTFRWQANDNTRPLHTGLRAGNYTVIVADGNHCSDTAVAIITQPTPVVLNVSAFKNVACSDGGDAQILLQAQGGAGNFAYSLGNTWQDESAFDQLHAGTYSPIVRDANGCADTITLVISEPAPIEVEFDTIAPALCGDPIGKIYAQVSGGTGHHSLVWKNAYDEGIGSEAIISGLAGGVYTLFVRDENLCEVTASAGVPSSNGPTVDVIAISPASCSYAADGAALLEAHGKDPFAFRWQDGNASPYRQRLRKGTYQVEVSDSTGCLTVVPVTVSAPDSLYIRVAEKTMPACDDDCNGAIRLEAFGGTGAYQYTWADASGPALDELCAGTYTVTVSDENRCESTATVELYDPPSIEASLIAVKAPTCPNGCDARIEVQASGGTGDLRYLWSNGDTEPVTDGICAGEHSVVITDANQCTASLHHTVEDSPAPTLDLGGSVVLCGGQTYHLDAGPAWADYLWGSDQGTAHTGRRLTISKPGAYWVEVVDGAGCTARDTFLLSTSDDLLKANFLLTTEAFALDTVVAIDISWPLPSAVRWSFPAEMLRLSDFGDVVYGQFPNPGLYAVTLSANLGSCSDQLTKTVNILEKGDRTPQGGKMGYQPLVQDFTVYPNPNNGRFNVAVSFYEETPIVLTLFDLFTSKVIAQIQQAGRRDYLVNFDLASMSAGAYSLRLDYRGERMYRRIIVR